MSLATLQPWLNGVSGDDSLNCFLEDLSTPSNPVEPQPLTQKTYG